MRTLRQMLTEISKKTAANYIAKAVTDMKYHAQDDGFERGHNVASGRNTQENPGGTKKNPIDKEHAEYIRKAHNRHNGIVKAAKRLGATSGYEQPHHPTGPESGIHIKK